MTYKEIKKYESIIKKIAGRRTTRHILVEDLISAAYEKLLKVKLRKENCYRHYIEYMIRYAIHQELQAHCPKPYRRNLKMPEHVEFDEHHTPPVPVIINYEKAVYEKEKIAQILTVCTSREKEFILLFLKDLNLTEIRKIMKISNVRIHEIIKNIKIKCKTPFIKF